MICWLIALRVVDRRRAFLVVVMLALYPIFNFRVSSTIRITQLVTLPLVVLAYLNAFEKRSVTSGLWLGIAGAGADDEILGADHDRRHPGCGADPSRALAVPAFAGAVGCDCNPRGGDECRIDLAEECRLRAADLRRRYLCADEPGADLAAGARLYRPQSRAARVADRAGGARTGPGASMVEVSVAAAVLLLTRNWSRRPDSGVDRSRTLNVWIIRLWSRSDAIRALVFEIYIKTD